MVFGDIFSIFGDIFSVPEWDRSMGQDYGDGAAARGVLKRDEVSCSVRAVIKAALAPRSLALLDEARAPQLLSLLKTTIELHAKFSPAALRDTIQEVRGILPPNLSGDPPYPPEPLPPPEPGQSHRRRWSLRRRSSRPTN